MNDINTPLYVLLKPELHSRLKAYAALNNASMKTVIEQWIADLSFD